MKYCRPDRIDIPLIRRQVLPEQHLGAVRLASPRQQRRQKSDHGFEPWRERVAPFGQAACLVHRSICGQVDAQHEIREEERLVELEKLSQLVVPLRIVATPIAGTPLVPLEP